MAPAAAAAAPAVKSDDEDDYEEYIPISKRRAMEADRLRHQRLSKPTAPSSAGSPASLPPPPPQPTTNPAAAPDAVAPSAKPSLLVTSTQLKRAAPEVTATEQLILQEKEMIENLANGRPQVAHVRVGARQGDHLHRADPHRLEAAATPPPHAARQGRRAQLISLQRTTTMNVGSVLLLPVTDPLDPRSLLIWASSEASSGAAGLRLELFGSDLEKQGESGILAAGVC